MVDEGWVMYSERMFGVNNDLNTILSVGVGRTISRRVALCQTAESMTGPS